MSDAFAESHQTFLFCYSIVFIAYQSLDCQLELWAAVLYDVATLAHPQKTA